MVLVVGIPLIGKKIRRPLLARGTKAAGMGLIRFLTIGGHAFQLSGYAFISLEAQIGRWSPAPDQGLRIRYITKNPSIFNSVFKAQEIKKKHPPRASKKREMRYRNSIKTISMKIEFRHTFLTKTSI